MSINAGTVSASLTLDTSQYTENLNTALIQMKTFIGDCVLLTVNLQSLGLAFNNTAISAVTMNQQIMQGVLALSAVQKDIYAEDLNAFTSLLAQKKAAHLAELESQWQSVNNLYQQFSEQYRLDGALFLIAEKLKTINHKSELKTRENDLHGSMQQMLSIMGGFVSSFQALGIDYANALLAGIQSTRSLIQAYLSSISSAIRSASEGNGATINAYARGTSYAKQGLAVVGENGNPEIVDFSDGEQVLNFNQTMDLLNNVFNGLNQKVSA